MCSLARQHLPPLYMTVLFYHTSALALPCLTVPLHLDSTDHHLQMQGALGHLGSQNPDANADPHVVFGTLLVPSGMRDLRGSCVTETCASPIFTTHFRPRPATTVPDPNPQPAATPSSYL
ncbi:UNVERIFIED_CONTAM: hypothetical protein FKN15_003122 [Acipenser sinensis]